MTPTRTADRGHTPSPRHAATPDTAPSVDALAVMLADTLRLPGYAARHAAVPVDPWNLPADPGACGCGSPLPPHTVAEHGEVTAVDLAIAEWETAR